MEPNTEIRDNRSKENRYNNRSSRNSESDLEESTAILHSCTKQDKQTPSDVLLKTATAPVWSGRQCMISNILFDEGAQRSFITSDLAAKLQITPTGTTFMQISSFGGAENTVRRLEKCTIQLETTAKDKISMELFIVPQLATPIKYRRRIDISRLNYLKNLELAHPLSGEESFNIDILIGADFYWKFVEDKVIRGDGPTAVLSKLGYLLSGPIHSGGSGPNTESLMMNILADHKLEECDFERFWNIESLGIENQNRSENYTDIAKEYADTSIEFLHGKYTAKLPWKAEMPELQSNFGIVKRRTENVIRRLGRDPDLLRMYSKVLSEQEEKGFIERVDIASDCTNRIHYIPHHPVLKESATTPVRVVYDCSCRDGNRGPSLNDCLESHSPNLNDLPGILTRFRLKQYAVTTDIEKAFLQIGLHQEDRDVTRFLWLSDSDDISSPLITYRFKSILFGATSSPFILNATLLKHFKVNPSDTAQVLERDLYVDNVLSSFDEKQRVIGFYHESRELLAKGGFNLRSWNSNCENLRTVASKEGVLDTENVVKILGMLWNVMTDMLLFSQTKFDISGEGNTTKRDILKQSSRIFDPLGILSPITVKAKILMQTLWKQNFGWDEHLPKRIETEWKELANEIEEATSTKVPRHLLSKQYSSNSKTLHVFTDASLQAYGAVVYIVDGEQSNFVMAKNRVAPIKSMTLPRLELMGALLGARLVKYIQNNVDVSEVLFWCDSQIVINWISSNKQLKQFIQNRVTEIKDLSGGNIWRYCPTCDNPADFLTRGIPISKFKGNKKWLHGPDWILEPNKWPVWNIVNPSTTLCVSADDEFNESKSDPTRSAENSCHREPFGLLDVLEVERFGSYMKLLRVVSYIFRFIGNCRKRLSQRNYNSLKCEEMKEASVTLLRAVQRKSYIKEMDNLKSINTKRLPLVKQLRLYLDNNGLLRCGGRINNAPIEESTKFPYLLPPKCHFTELIIKDAHEKQKHGSLNNTITFIQQTYWIPKIRQCVKKILRKCLPCLKIMGKPYQAPDPPPLPQDRLQCSSPFSVTGVDFTGALYVKGTGGTEIKAYLCLFTCASTRAIHLELVPDLTEKSFILAFRRFVSRRSLPRTMISDNCSTYKSASVEISHLCNSTRVQESLGNYRVEWKFIPSRAPWYGGWWERLIGLTKASIKKVLGRSHVDYDTLSTIITEIEAILNDRPLTYISTDPRDVEPLTPSDLLYGRRLTSLPYPPLPDETRNILEQTNAKFNEISRRQRDIIQHFWNRWKQEYITSLREFHRISGKNEQCIQKGDIVQIHDDTSRLTWKLAVVEELVRGRDGFIRSATVRTQNGLTNRPIVKLYPLEIGDDRHQCEETIKLRRSDRLNKK